MIIRANRRKGVTVVECAFVFPVFFLLIIGTIVAGVGVFRYQEIAALAREGRAMPRCAATPTSARRVTRRPRRKRSYDTIILPKAYGLDKKKLKYTVTWGPDKEQGSLVTVDLKYHWIPEAYFGGMELSSTSTVLISY